MPAITPLSLQPEYQIYSRIPIFADPKNQRPVFYSGQKIHCG